MTVFKNDIINQLQKDILVLQGFKAPNGGTALDIGLGHLETAFPNGCFPTGAVHEFLTSTSEHGAATSGFITGLLSGLLRKEQVCVWISISRTLFPPALKSFGVEPDRIIFIDLKREKDVLWAMEEALKCEGLAAVIGEIKEISFTASRRLQLAVEQSRVTGFVIRQNPRNGNTIACVCRWKIVPLPSELEGNMPGVGFPRWNIELLKVRNGRPGVWQMEWSGSRFQPVVFKKIPDREERRKTG